MSNINESEIKFPITVKCCVCGKEIIMNGRLDIECHTECASKFPHMKINE